MLFDNKKQQKMNIQFDFVHFSKQTAIVRLNNSCFNFEISLHLVCLTKLQLRLNYTALHLSDFTQKVIVMSEVQYLTLCFIHTDRKEKQCRGITFWASTTCAGNVISVDDAVKTLYKSTGKFSRNKLRVQHKTPQCEQKPNVQNTKKGCKGSVVELEVMVLAMCKK